jgi:hypothetical protein
MASWTILNRVLLGIVIACAIALAIPAFYGLPQINPWISLSVLLIFLSFGLFAYLIRGHAGGPARLLIVALVLFDLSAFDWTARNKIQLGGTDHLERAVSCRGAADFLKSRPGLYRVRIVADEPPNLGDLFRVRTVSGRNTTLTTDFVEIIQRNDLLNARYELKPASAAEPGAIYQDSAWKVYENPNAYPAAWVVHETIVEPSRKQLFARLNSPEVDPHRQALLSGPLKTALESRLDTAVEDVRFDSYEPNELNLNVHAGSRGLLVLSEMFDAGWRATVNGNSAPIYKVRSEELV